jgi:AraC family L-rhamnose operon regulatory protein RhaS
MVNFENLATGVPSIAFQDMDDIYYADTCDALQGAVDRGEVAMSALARGHYPGSRLPDQAVLGLKTVGFWDASLAQNWGLEWHRNEGIEITYLARGTLGFAVDEQSCQLHPNQLTITRPWQRHRVGLPNVGPSRLHWMILDVQVRRPHQKWQWPSWINLASGDLERLTRLMQLNEQPIWTANRHVHVLFEDLARCTQTAPRTTESRLQLTISALLLEMLELLESQTINLDEQLSSVRRGVSMFLDDLVHYIDRRWTVNDMADRCSLGRTQFANYCQELTNMTPIEYLNNLRMARAVELLSSSPEMSISEIGYACGFDTSQYFSSSFSKFHKMSPRQYRNKMND